MSHAAAPTHDGNEPTAHPPGFRLRRGQNWFFLGLMYASYYLCRYNLSIIAPELKKDLNLKNEEFGTIQTGRDWAYALGQFINGLFSDRLGGKLTMTLGALGTVLFNVLFGMTCIWLAGVKFTGWNWLLIAIVVVRSLDGYVQAFGAPGMVKINTAWFRRAERGGFAGIFGGMIQLGAIGVGLIGKLFTTGTLVLIGFSFYSLSLTGTKLGWKAMFFVPPAIVLIVVVLMNFFVKNHPEETGFRVVHEDESADDDPHARIHLKDVFRTIVSNPVVWIVAAAYFCTGFVRRAIESYWVIWLTDAWHLNKSSGVYDLLVWSIPLTAFLGSLGSGLISDKLFRGRRAPVAALLYLFQAVFTVVGVWASISGGIGGVGLAAAVLIGINMMCNSTHSILGTAAPMDLGGRKMAGFAAGVIDSFQYIGAGLAGKFLGRLLDTAAAAKAGAVATTGPAVTFNSTTWFVAMLPFGALGALLMGYLWLRHRGSQTRGA